MANIKQGIENTPNNSEYTRRGPYLSVSIPTITRAGIAKATFKVNNIFTSASDRPSESLIACSMGARLNQTTNVMKKAIQVRCKIFIFPEKEKRLNFSDDMADSE